MSKVDFVFIDSYRLIKVSLNFNLSLFYSHYKLGKMEIYPKKSNVKGFKNLDK